MYRCLCAFLLAAGMAYGQAQVAAADLKGKILDATGLAIVKATVTVTDPDRGVSRTVQSNSEGEFLAPALQPGKYRVRIEAPGFNTKIMERIELHVGETVNLPVTLDLSPISTEVNVIAEAPVVETQRTQQASTIQFEQIRSLPINRRNYLDMALLTPGVVETNDMVDGSDFRVAQAPQSGLSFGGSNGRGNVFSIDGVENFINSGGVRPALSQEAVEEFQVNRNSFSAEIGGGFGGAINVVSKSGTNKYHGNLFGFLRQRSIQARNYFDPEKSAYTRVQSGATLGGPIVKDKTHFFLAFERLDRHETAFVPIYQDRTVFGKLTTSQQQLVDFFNASGVPSLQGLAATMSKALTTNNYPNTLKLFNANSGNFAFKETSNQASLRLDHRFSGNHSIFLRGNLTDNPSENAQFGALLAFNRGRSINVLDGTWMLTDTWLVNQKWVSETRASFSYNRIAVIPTDPFGPEINITGYGLFGREIFLPSRTYERQVHLKQNMNYLGGKHNVKFGGEVAPVRDVADSATFFSGRFSFGSRVPLGEVLNQATGNPNFATGLASTLASLGKASLIPNLSAGITSLQSYNLGLPEFYQQGFGDPHWLGWSKRYNFFLQDTYRLHPRLTLNFGARYELEVNEKILGTDPNNIAPRFGFAWTPTADSRTVIRGGYGMYYSQNNLQVANVADTLAGKQIGQVFVPLTGLPGLNNPLTGKTLTSADVYRTLMAQGVIGNRSITRADIAPFGLNPGPGTPLSVVFGIAPGFVNPYAHQASFEIERAVEEMAFSVAYNFNRAAHIVRILDRNLYYSGRLDDGTPTFGFYNPLVSQLNIFESSANSFYHALTAQVSRRMRGRHAFMAHYTFSKAMDEVTDFNTDFQPHDQLNARAERALSAFHQKHRMVASAVLMSPWQTGKSGSFASRLFGDFILSPVVSANSGRPFNVLTGVDNLNDRHSTTHRPLGLGRNVGRGPNYVSFDTRLTRKFVLGADGMRNIEFTAEGFNLLNRTNFKSINNTVGNIPMSQLPNPLVGTRGIPTEALAFTSAFDPRQFQFGLKINF